MTSSEALSETLPESLAAQSNDERMPKIDTINEPISMSSLLDRLGKRKPEFLNSVESAIHACVARQGRRVCMSVVETNGRGNGQPHTHIFNSDSLSEVVTYANVFQRFIRKEKYHGNDLDSGLSKPLADVIAWEYCTLLESCSDDLKQYFLGRLVEDEVVRKSLAVHIATLLANKGVKTARDKLTHIITHAIAQHVSTHTAVAVHHGVTVTTMHTATFTTGASTGDVVGFIVGAVITKMFAAHITVVLAKVLVPETFRVLVTAVIHKMFYVGATAAATNSLTAKASVATAAGFLHAIIIPLIISYVGYKVKTLPNELGKSIAKGVKQDLDGNFRTITEQVLDEMAKEVCDLEKLASAFVGEWEKVLDGLDDTDPAVMALYQEIESGVGYVNSIQEMMEADEALNGPHDVQPAHVADFVCPTCDLNLGPLDDNDKLVHANECLDQRERDGDSIIRCWWCCADFQGMSNAAKNEHLNDCLDRTPPQMD